MSYLQADSLAADSTGAPMSNPGFHSFGVLPTLEVLWFPPTQPEWSTNILHIKLLSWKYSTSCDMDTWIDCLWCLWLQLHSSAWLVTWTGLGLRRSFWATSSNDFELSWVIEELLQALCARGTFSRVVLCSWGGLHTVSLCDVSMKCVVTILVFQ